MDKTISIHASNVGCDYIVQWRSSISSLISMHASNEGRDSEFQLKTLFFPSFQDDIRQNTPQKG